MKAFLFFFLVLQPLFADPPLYLIYLGGPGAGKGTQARFQVEKYSLPHISVGALLREKVRKKDSLGMQIQEYMNQGVLIPRDIAFLALVQRLRQKDCEGGALLDGTSRSLATAKRLLDNLPSRSQFFVFYLDVPQEVLVTRLLSRLICPLCDSSYHPLFAVEIRKGLCDRCGVDLIQRSDDRLEAIQNRINLFSNNIQFVLDFYENQGVLYRLDGTLCPQEISSQIDQIILEKRKRD